MNKHIKPSHNHYFSLTVKALIKNPQGQYLFIQRSEKCSSPLKWSLPGGRLENEDPQEGITREIYEETQLEVDNLLPAKITSFKAEDGTRVVIIYYTCDLRKNIDPILNWEHDNYKWLSLIDALNLDLTSNTKSVINSLI